jgi:predicted nucleic-acid-binding protein
MIALDTNILARAIIDEEEADEATLQQQEQARNLLSSGQELFLPVTVIEELEWVLRGVYRLPKDEIFGLIEDLLTIDTLVIDRAAAVARAVDGYRHGLDFSDALHLAQSGLCSRLATFDGRFLKLAKRLKLHPPVTEPRQISPDSPACDRSP